MATREDRGSSDAELIAVLDRSRTAEWVELCALADDFAGASEDVTWTPMQHRPDGSLTLPYPQYTGRVDRATSLLASVGAVTPLARWMDHPMPDHRESGILNAADAVRAATAVIRGERFADGTIADAVDSGLLHAILVSLCAWYRGTGDLQSTSA